MWCASHPSFHFIFLSMIVYCIESEENVQVMVTMEKENEDGERYSRRISINKRWDEKTIKIAIHCYVFTESTVRDVLNLIYFFVELRSRRRVLTVATSNQ